MGKATGGSAPENATEQAIVLAGGGELAARMRAIDWAATPLGPVADWPRALKTCVRLLLTSRQPMWLAWGDELTYLYNDAYRSIIGGKHPWALGQPLQAVWREIWDDVGPRIQAALEGTEGTYDEALLLLMERHGYREETYYTFSYSPVPDDEGRICGIFCANTDDTLRIIGERQLALLRDLAAGRTESRTIADACALAARILGANPRDLPFALLYLIEPDQSRAVLAGTTNLPPGHPVAPATVALGDMSAWPLAEVLGTGAPCPIPLLATASDSLPTGAWDRPPERAVALPIAPAGETGRAGVLIVGLNPYRLYDEQYAGFLGLVAGQIAAAMADAQAYEEERRRAEALADLDRAKTTFFANISHEFRTPLTLMLGSLEDTLGGAHGDLAPAQHAELALVQRNGLRLLRLVNMLLNFSRIEAGRVRASFEPTDLPALTADLASTFRSAVERAGLRLEVDTPPLHGDTVAYIDREMWEQIVLNLLSNAFKFTLAGEIAVALRTAPDGRAVTLTVRDTGTGIPVDELPHLFERFHRVQGAQARTHEGTGIGLAMVQELVRLHGGTIAVASEEDRGTTFSVTLPTGSAHLPPEQIAEPGTEPTPSGAATFVEEALRWLPETVADPPERAVGVPDTPVPLARVLLADDNADMREYVARLLGTQYAVEAVADGEAALASALAQPPDLVLSDVMMPRLDGFGLLRALRHEPSTREVPVILLSARAGQEASVEAMSAGADDYLVKPFAARELLARVGAHLTLARARTEATRREQAARIEAEAGSARLRELFEQAPAAIAVLRGPTHIYELANPAYAELFGVQRAYVGRPVREVFADVDAAPVWELLDRVYAAGRSYVGTEWPLLIDREGDGTPEERHYNFVFQPTRDAGGAVAGIFIQAIDVTDQVGVRREVERLAVESEDQRRRYEALLDASPDHTFLLDRAGRFDYVNRAAAEVLAAASEIAADTPLGRSGRDLGLPAAFLTHFEANHARALAGETVVTEALFPTPRGARRFEYVLSPVLGAAGATEKVVGVTRDIDDRERDREALRASEARLRLALDVAGLGTWSWDLATGTGNIDERGAAIIGSPPGFLTDVAGAQRASIHPDDLARVEADVAAGTASGAAFDLAYRVVHPEGEVRHVASRVRVVQGEAGRPTRLVGTNRDVTDERRAAEERERLLAAEQEARATAEEAIRARDTFLSIAAHELKTPVTALKAGSQLLLRQHERGSLDEARLTRTLSSLDRAAGRLMALISDLLDATRLRTGQLEFTPRPEDLAALVAEVATQAVEAYGETHRLTLDLPPALPPVALDAGRIEQVLTNLLDNAVKYSPQGGEVAVAVREDGTRARVTVRDAGIGLPPETGGAIFEPFSRARNASASHLPGMGLGLHICRTIVERHGGRIDVESAGEGQGTTATFWLPFAANSGESAGQ